MPGLLHIVLNDYMFDNRVRRAAEAGVTLGQPVAVFALHRPPLPRIERHGAVCVLRFALVTRAWSKAKPVQMLKYLEAALRMIARGIIRRPALVHAHDADALPIGWIIARCTGARLVYDAHELWSDPDRIHQMTALIFRLLQIEERTLARRCQCVITVSGRIAAYLRATLRIRLPLLVRNLPERWLAVRGTVLRRLIHGSGEPLVVLFQGVIAGGGPLLLLNAFRKVSGDVALVYLGNGSGVDDLTQRVNSDTLLKGRVFFHPAVPSAALHEYTSSADIGVHPMTHGPLNHAWALPNKLFEYMQGGLAIVASELPEMANVIRSRRCGLTFTPDEEDGLRHALQTMVDNAGFRDSCRNASRLAAEELCWEREREVLVRAYKHLLSRPPIAP